MSLLTTCDNKHADNALMSILIDGLLSFSFGLLIPHSSKKIIYYLKYLIVVNTFFTYVYLPYLLNILSFITNPFTINLVIFKLCHKFKFPSLAIVKMSLKKYMYKFTCI